MTAHPTPKEAHDALHDGESEFAFCDGDGGTVCSTLTALRLQRRLRDGEVAAAVAAEREACAVLIEPQLGPGPRDFEENVLMYRVRTALAAAIRERGTP